MNRGLLLRAAREVLATTLVLGAVLMLFEAILAYVLPSFQQQFSQQILQLQFMQGIIKAMIGADVSKGLGPEMFQAIPWVHPVVMAVVWAHAVIVCTRVPAAEVDRGTIDVLLGLPVSRRQVFLNETLLCLVAGAVVLTMGLAGNLFGRSLLAPDLRSDPGRLVLVLVNLLCLYAAVSGLSWLASSLSSRRGAAVGAAFVVLLASFLLNYVAQLWSVAERFGFLSLMNYHRPLIVLRDGDWPWRDIAVLLGVGGAMWGSAGVVFARRDLRTV